MGDGGASRRISATCSARSASGSSCNITCCRAMTRLVEQLVALARELGLGYVATNNVHYATRERHRLQDVLVCIRHHTTLDRPARCAAPTRNTT